MEFDQCEYPECEENATVTVQRLLEEGGGLIHTCKAHRAYFNRHLVRDPRRRDRGTMLDWHESRSDYGLDSEDLRREPTSDNLVEGF